MNVTSKNEHFPEVGRQNRVIKERAQAIVQTLPYEVLSHKIRIVYLTKNLILCITLRGMPIGILQFHVPNGNWAALIVYQGAVEIRLPLKSTFRDSMSACAFPIYVVFAEVVKPLCQSVLLIRSPLLVLVLTCSFRLGFRRVVFAAGTLLFPKWEQGGRYPRWSLKWRYFALV
jgi:hypothetical protein